jgi:3-oxoacyl-[acyl-carrier protein] reductase
MMGRLDGKTALVTGAGRGIGRGIARRLAADGARVIVHYTTSEGPAAELVRELEAAGGSAFAVRADISEVAAIEAMFAEIRRRVDGLDILVNNAGRGSGGAGTLGGTTQEGFDAIFATNARGTFFVTKSAEPMLRDGGRVINISSTTIKVRMGAMAVYAASKCAIEAFTRCWSAELAPRQITVNSVVPGIVDTDLISALSPELKARSIASVPLGRIGQPEDIAGVVAFLASDDSRWVTGEQIVASGGN